MMANAQTVTTYVTTSGNPTGIVFDATGTLYIGGESDYSVRKFTPAGTLSVLRTDMNGQPRQLAVDHTGQLWIAFQMLASFKSMNPTTGSTVSYPASLPFGIAQHPVNHLIYFSESGSDNKIYTYNDTTGNIVALPNTVMRPRGLAFDAAGNLYVASYTTASVMKIDTAGNLTTVVNNVNYPAYLALDGNNNLYISTESSGKIYKYSLAKTDMQAELFVQGLDYANGLAVYNGNLYCAVASQNKVVKISLAQSLATAEVQTAGQGVALYPNPVSDVLTIATDKKVGQTRIYSADGRLVNTAENQKTLDVSALKSGVYFLNTEIGGAAVKAKFIKK